MNIMKNYAKRRSFFLSHKQMDFLLLFKCLFPLCCCFSSFSLLLFISVFPCRLNIHIEVGVYCIVSKGKFNKLVVASSVRIFLLFATFSSRLFHYFVFNVSALFSAYLVLFQRRINFSIFFSFFREVITPYFGMLLL